MKNYWTDKEQQALESVSTFEETADLAISILARMKTEEPSIVQICGPMSTGGLGNLEQNMIRFERAIDSALEHGLVVFDQVPFQSAIIRISRFQEGQKEYCMEILEIFYKRLFMSGHISKALFLPDWQSSKGATWERQILSELNIHIEEYPPEWL